MSESIDPAEFERGLREDMQAFGSLSASMLDSLEARDWPNVLASSMRLALYAASFRRAAESAILYPNLFEGL
jgi:hypothetical protein